jgi:bifunctional DNase/RNase
LAGHPSGIVASMIEMELVGVRVELPSNTPIVLLRETEGERRMLPIYIGGPEATAIALALEEVVTPRPMTHDLIKILLAELSADVERIVVTDLEQGTFFADIVLKADGEDRRVSSRPSDAIALAVRMSTPIFAEEKVLDEVGYTVDEDEQKEQVVEEFKEFIENVSPEDFAS